MKFSNNLIVREIPPWKLRLGEYVARNFEQWRRAFVFTLFFLDIIVIVILVVVFAGYASGIPRHAALELELSSPSTVNYQGFHARHRTLPLTIDRIQSVVSRAGELDMVALITNPNTEWAVLDAEISFRLGAALISPPVHIFLMPREQRTTAVFRVKGGAHMTVPSVSARVLAWRKIKDSVVSLQGIQSSDFSYTPLPQGTALDFKVSNGSAYSLWRAPLVVTAWQGETLVGAASLFLDNLRSGESRIASFAWNYSLSPVSHTTVDVQINLLDPAVFMDPSGVIPPP